MLIKADSSLNRTASWVIVETATQRVICETFSAKVVAALNTKRYSAVPIGEWLGSLNRKHKRKLYTAREYPL
jgi:hypothetical protein